MPEITKLKDKLRYKGFKLRPTFFPELILLIFFVLSIIVKSLYFQVSNQLSSAPIHTNQNTRMFIASLAMTLLLLPVVLLFSNRKRYTFLFILDMLVTLLLAADTIYFRYYHNAITVPVLLQVGLLGPLGGSIKGLLKSSDLIFFFDFPIIIGGIIFLKYKGLKNAKFYRRAIAAVLVALAGTIVFSVNYSNINTLWFAYDKNQIIKDVGIFYFHYHDVANYIHENLFSDKILTENEKNQITAFFAHKPKTEEDYKGIAKGKNLIIIQIEAFQEFLINRKIENAEITPNLNKLVKESIHFNNFHYQVGEGNTSDAEFLCNTSQYPAKQGAVYFRYPVNTYHTLPKALNEQGYNTYAFHAYHPSFWNRTVMYKAIGFDKFISDKDYEPGDVIGFGLNDTSFFQQSIKKIDKSRPFYGFFVTLSSHYAFGSFKYYNFNVGKYEGTDIGNYIKAANYVDKSIGVMLEELKRNGLYDNTLLVIYGDHHSFPKGQADGMIEFLGMDNSDFQWILNQKVPLIIHYPGLKNGEAISTTGGELDIFPTVANLMGLDIKYAFGKDLLNTKSGYAVLRNGSVVTDKYVFVNDKAAVYDKNTEKILDLKDYEEEIKKYQNQLNISDIIMEKDAFSSIK